MPGVFGLKCDHILCVYYIQRVSPKVSPLGAQCVKKKGGGLSEHQGGGELLSDLPSSYCRGRSMKIKEMWTNCDILKHSHKSQCWYFI